MTRNDSDPYGHAWQKLREEAYRVYGYVCWLCGQPIDRTLPRGHPMSRSVDHLDPVSVHGPAVPDISRVRPAHLAHNSSRGSGRRPTAGPTGDTAYSQRW